MDNYASGGIGAVSILVLAIIARLIVMINHHRIKSECMGKKFSASIDIQPTTPDKNLSEDKNGRQDSV
jgi:hypothetical protein